MISVLTAVVSNAMIDATSDRKEKEIEDYGKTRRCLSVFVWDICLEADIDGNSVLDSEEFEASMSKDIMLTEMQNPGIDFTPEEFKNAWQMLDVDGLGGVNLNGFVVGCSYLQEGLSTKHVINMEYGLKRIRAKFEVKLHKAQAEIK